MLKLTDDQLYGKVLENIAKGVDPPLGTLVIMQEGKAANESEERQEWERRRIQEKKWIISIVDDKGTCVYTIETTWHPVLGCFAEVVGIVGIPVYTASTLIGFKCGSSRNDPTHKLAVTNMVRFIMKRADIVYSIQVNEVLKDQPCISI